MIRPRASDRLADRSSVRDPEFLESCACAIALWKSDLVLHSEFEDIVCLFDFIFSEADRLIESATEN